MNIPRPRPARRLALLSFCLAALFIRNAGAQPAAPVVPAAQPLQILEARLSQLAFEGGEPVWLDITLVNKSTRPVSFLMLGPRLEFKMRREGKQVGLTYKAKDESKGDKISYRSVLAGQTFRYRVVLNRVFDLSRAGNYSLSCTKFLRNEAPEPGAELVGVQVVAPLLKFSVAETDLQPAPQTTPNQPVRPQI